MSPHKHQHAPHQDEHVDPWHHHEPIEGTPQHEHGGRVNTFLLGFSFLAIVATVVGIGAAVVVYFQHYRAQIMVKSVETTVAAAEVNEYKAAALGTLETGYAVVDPKAGTVSIPLADAREQILARYQAR